MSEINAKDLLKKYAEGQCSPEEKALVETYYNQFSSASKRELITHELESHVDHIWESLSPRPKYKRFKLMYGIAASIALTLCSAALYFYVRHEPVKTNHVAQADVVPGSRKAVLTLADGSKISINEVAKGAIAAQAGASIIKMDDGNLSYKPNDIALVKQQWNTIETPRGGEFQITLPDGTKVWLNAASSLEYPVAFTGKERNVRLKGEAYFEVAHDRSKPFKVLTATQEVEVLGTHFSINAYNNTITKTILAEGSVKVKALEDARVRLLKPGQLALLDGKSLQVATADIESELAWKNGYFIFNTEGLGSIMEKISRWYDIEVVYGSREINNELKFGGIVSRNKPISAVLKMMERTGKVHFKLDGNKVTILP